MESGGVRKGAWSMEEDILLTKCIEKYGEGNWHRVPLRAGLNRCRKSCRLRWLNYLRPGIKRGKFTLDEVDLMMRLHKLLGNRWSLIAGRLPGRTANDVKNYWNTHLLKRMGSCSDEGTAKARLASKTEIVKPQPWHFSKSLSGLRLKPKTVDTVQSQGSHSEASPTLPQPNDETTGWDSHLAYSHKGDQGDDLIASLWAEAAVPTANVVEEFPISPIYDFTFDVALWDIC